MAESALFACIYC